MLSMDNLPRKVKSTRVSVEAAAETTSEQMNERKEGKEGKALAVSFQGILKIRKRFFKLQF
jgi:hypothetical protein